MPLALILSSFVARSRIGGAAQQYAFAPFGIDPVLVPTVLFGRSPARGAPGGAAVAADTFRQMLLDIEAEGLFVLPRWARERLARQDPEKPTPRYFE